MSIARLHEEFDAELQVSVRRHPSLSVGARARARAAAEDTIRACTLCPAHDKHAPFIPQWPGHSMTMPSTIAIIMPAPEPRYGYSGKSAKLIAGVLGEHGVDVKHEVTFLSVNQCPITDTQGHSRLQTDHESKMCRSNMIAALDASGARYVLLAGGAATHAWRSDVTLKNAAGRLFVWRSRFYVMPVQNPETVLRGLRSTPEDYGRFKMHLARFVSIMREDMGVDALSDSCVKCHGPVDAFDRDGVPWCKKHAEKGLGGHEKSRKKWADAAIGQGTLL